MSHEILILDTPGVIPQNEYSNSDQVMISKHAKINARDWSKVRDAEYVVSTLMKDYAPQIEKFYSISVNGNAERLIEEVGKQKNLLKKGGIVNEDRAARVILRDWQEGKIKI